MSMLHLMGLYVIPEASDVTHIKTNETTTNNYPSVIR